MISLGTREQNSVFLPDFLETILEKAASYAKPVFFGLSSKIFDLIPFCIWIKQYYEKFAR